MPAPGPGTNNPMNDEPQYIREVNLEVRDSLTLIVERVPRGSEVLELGTATGYLGRFLGEQWDCTVDGVELIEDMAGVARPAYRRLVVADLEEKPLREHFPAGGYDTVICADVLEHLYNPAAIIAQIEGMLKPGGRLVVSVPNIAYAGLIMDLIDGNFEYSELGLLDRTHIRFFTRATVTRMIEEQGFRITDADVVHWPFEQSEFYQRLRDRPLPLKNYLFARPDGDVYQFILVAEPAG